MKRFHIKKQKVRLYKPICEIYIDEADIDDTEIYETARNLIKDITRNALDNCGKNGEYNIYSYNNANKSLVIVITKLAEEERAIVETILGFIIY